MRQELQLLCDAFLKDRDMAKGVFTWDSSYMPPICAGILADKKEEITAERLIACRQMIKDKTGVFSSFRGNAIAPMTCMLAISDRAEELLNGTLKVYEAMKKHYWSSDYLPLVSLIIAGMADEYQLQQLVEKTRNIYEMMREKHPFLTSAEDGPFAALLAFSDLSAETITAETEKCYQLLKDKFFFGNAVQSLSHVLALGEGSAQEKCRRLTELFDLLKAKGYAYGTDYELSTLGAVSILPGEIAALTEDMIAVTEYLGKQKGYGFFGATKKQRMMHAAMIVCKAYSGEKDNRTAYTGAINSTIAMIAAQQAAMCAAIAATAAANSTSN